MSQLRDLVQAIKNVPNDNLEYDIEKTKQLVLEWIGEDEQLPAAKTVVLAAKIKARNELRRDLRQIVELQG